MPITHHFSLTDETRTVRTPYLRPFGDPGRLATVHRIRAEIDLPMFHVASGDLGGFVEHHENLGPLAWVADDSFVCGDARIDKASLVRGHSRIEDRAIVTDEVRIEDRSIICGDAHITDRAQIYDSIASMRAEVSGDAMLTDGVHITEDASATDSVLLSGKIHLSRNAQVKGSFASYGAGLHLGESVLLEQPHHVLSLQHLGSSGASLVLARSYLAPGFCVDIQVPGIEIPDPEPLLEPLDLLDTHPLDRLMRALGEALSKNPGDKVIRSLRHDLTLARPLLDARIELWHHEADEHP